jgi:hypothetical protein
LQNIQAKNRRMIQALQPWSTLGKALKDATIKAHRYAVANTHVWNGGANPTPGRNYGGGGLRASHLMEVTGYYGRVYIGHGTNPRGQDPAVYGPYEHARGGAHAFYSRVLSEHGKEISGSFLRILKGGL